MGGVLGVPHCGSRGFGSEDNSGREEGQGRPFTGLPSVGVYTCMYLRMYIHGWICMRVCGQDWVSYMDNEGLQR